MQCSAASARAWQPRPRPAAGADPAQPPRPAIRSPQPTGALTGVSVTVSSKASGSVPARFAGLSYEKSSMAVPRFQASNTNLIGLFQALGTSLLRIGGNSVDQTQWAPTGAGRTSGEVAPSDIDALAAFLEASGWTVLYGVNFATSTAAAAAAEVAYAAKSLGQSLYAIEIGNECDLYGGTGSYFAGDWSLADFERRWESLRSAILAATPDVVLTAPASSSHVTTWTIPFGQHVGGQQIAELTQHDYRGDGASPSSTIAELVSPDATLLSELAELAAGASSIGIPYRIAETNSFYNGGAPGVSDSYASALWVLDHLYSIALSGGAGANLHGRR